MSHQMNHPPVVELENIAGCRYMLVTAVAKRARQLLVSKEESSDKKPVAKTVQRRALRQVSCRILSDFRKIIRNCGTFKSSFICYAPKGGGEQHVCKGNS